MLKDIQIEKRRVGHGHPVYIVAEAGLNHGGDLQLAIRMVETAAAAGADAIKFQTFDTDRRFGDDEAAKALVRPAEFDLIQFEALAHAAKQNHIHFLSSAFDGDAVDMLSGLNASALKIASCDICNIDLLKKAGQAGLPVLLSRGTAGQVEIDRALQIFDEAHSPLALFHCVSSYPLQVEDANLGAIRSLREAYDVPIGYSDHTTGIDVPLHAVYAGACAIEKHYTLDRGLRGIDWEISATPDELALLVTGVRLAERVLGHGRIEPLPCEEEEIRYRTSQRMGGG